MADSFNLFTPRNAGGSLRLLGTVPATSGPFVRNGDFLRLNLTSTDASATVTMSGRLLTMSGELVPFTQNMVVTGAGDQTAVVTPLTDGWITGFIVFVAAGTITSGEISASVDVVQGSGTGLTRMMCLASGEITNTKSLGLGAFT